MLEEPVLELEIETGETVMFLAIKSLSVLPVLFCLE